METTKQWQKPQLVILGRGTPEEKVLLGCKNPPPGDNTGPGRSNGCNFDPPQANACNATARS